MKSKMKKSKLAALLIMFLLVHQGIKAEEPNTDYSSPASSPTPSPIATQSPTSLSNDVELENQSAVSVTGQKFEGTGTVVDYTFTDSKIFYTIKTEDDKIFYLVIDRNKTENNAYFLREINEDEMNTISQPISTPTPILENVESKASTNNSNLTITFVALAAVGCVGLFLFLKTKKKNTPTPQNTQVIDEFEEFDENEEEE